MPRTQPSQPSEPGDDDLFLVAPPGADRPLHQLHDILTDVGNARMPGFFTQPDGTHVFHIQATDKQAVELQALAHGWRSIPKPT